jgi:hypothetical protein
MSTSSIGARRGWPFAVLVAPALALATLGASVAAGAGPFSFILAFFVAPLSAFARARTRGMTIEQASILACIAVVALFATIALLVIAMAFVYAAAMQHFN